MTIEFHPSLEKSCDSECPVCFSSKNKNHVLNVSAYSGELHLFCCDDCGTRFYFPSHGIRNYEKATENIAAVRHYVEVGASIEIMNRWIFKAIQPDIPGKFLDVGCGFGFCLDLVRHNSKWEVVGADPSNYAKLGGEWLNLQIYNSYFQDTLELKEKKFNCIFSSEVIEHVPDPYSFMRLLGEHIEPSGQIVITTPNADLISEKTDTAELQAILNPNEHIILFSKKSIQILLKKTGYKYYFIETNGSHIIFYASQREFQLNQNADNIALEKAYYSSSLKQQTINPYIKIGIGFRYYKLLINRGEYVEAAKLFEELDVDFSNIDNYNSASDIKEFGQIMPYCMPLFAFYRGIHLLNHGNNLEEASIFFALSYDLCLKVIAIMPNCCVEEKNILWHAKFHEGLALYRLNKYAEAKNAMKCFFSFQKSIESHIGIDKVLTYKFRIVNLLIALHNSIPGRLLMVIDNFLGIERNLRKLLNKS